MAENRTEGRIMNDDLLLQRYLDRKLSGAELTAFQQRLVNDEKLREDLRIISEQAIMFGDLARLETQVASIPPQRREKRIPVAMLALAASIVVLAVSAWLFLSGRPETILTLIESSGTVVWSDGSVAQTGKNLPAGTLKTLGEASTAQVRFRDGTLVTLHGETELTFSEESQKILMLSKGTLSAKVKPQPVNHPMVVRTPSAVVEVVGTAFDMTTRDEDTLLKVSEGLVRLKRLADGSEVEVAANHSAVASLQTAGQLAVNDTPEPLTAWSFDFTKTMPPREWRGQADDGVMNASPYIAKKHADGTVTTHYGVSIRTAMLAQPQRLLATEGSFIRFRLRQEQPGGLQVMLLTNRPEGGFSGNFECHIQAGELVPNGDGWCDLMIPLSRFSPVNGNLRAGKTNRVPAGNILTSIILSSFREDRGLTITRFELVPQQ